jgi:hypothetical protein
MKWQFVFSTEEIVLLIINLILFSLTIIIKLQFWQQFNYISQKK